MKKISRQFLAVLASLGLVIPQSAFMLSDVSGAVFNPNSIISDTTLQNWQTMNRSDIQAFLSEKNSYLEDLRTSDVNGMTRRASDIIYQASKAHKINPKYLLVKLQKEQSLITDQTPTQKQLDWATGYGICDSCSMSDPTLQKHRGFGTQVDSAAGIMRWYYEHMFSEPWIKTANETYMIDGVAVRPTSNATGFLYTYTPHLHGNENFWKLWERWFEQLYPNGTIVKSADSQTVYLISGNTKHAFSSMTALVSRYDPKMIIIISSAELARYETGPSISLPNYAILRNGTQYYLLDYETLRPFASYDTVKNLGYHPDEIIEVTTDDIRQYTTGKTIGTKTENLLGRVVVVKENGSLYFLDDDIYYPIADERIVPVNFPHLSLESVPATTLHSFTAGSSMVFKNGTIFGIEGSNKIYVAEDGKKRHIASEDVFNGLGYQWTTIVWVNQFAGMAHTTGEPIYLRADLDTTPEPVKNQTIVSVEEPTLTPENPTTIEDVMVRTPEDKISFIGTKFETNTDAYLVAEHDSETILAGKNIDTVRPLASLTKVLTGYHLMKQGLRTSRSTTYDPARHKAKYHYYRIAPGEQVLNKDLLSVLLVSSLNTPAYMLADNVSENSNEFVNGMNAQIREWGLSETHFSDPFGGEENVTTAREYLTIFTNSARNKEVKRALSMKSYEYTEIIDLDDKPHHYDTHTNDLVHQNHSLFNIIASKTGYLDEAGAVLAMLVERKTDGKKFVIITMGNPDINDRFKEPKNITNWALTNF